MRSLSAIDLHFLLPELKQLENSKIENISGADNHFSIELYHKSGKRFLNIFLPNLVFISDSRQVSGVNHIATYLRSHIRGCKISSISQHSLERILKLEVTSSTATISLILELFGTGNIIVTDAKGVILQIFESVEFKDRKLRVKEHYVLPPASAVLTEPALLASISSKPVAGILATVFGMGGFYAELVCKRSGVDKSVLALTKRQAKDIVESFNSLLKESPAPCVVMKSDVVAEWSPVFISNSLPMPTLSECLAMTIPKYVFKSPFQAKIKKTESIIEKQTEQLENLESEIVENTEIGEYIYNNYPYFKNILDVIQKMRSEMNLHDIAKKIKNPKASLDPVTGKFTIEIP